MALVNGLSGEFSNGWSLFQWSCGSRSSPNDNRSNNKNNNNKIIVIVIVVIVVVIITIW